MSQMNLKKKNLMNLGLNPGQLLLRVPDWVNCCVDLEVFSISNVQLHKNSMFNIGL